MEAIARRDPSERDELFQQTAANRGLSVDLVEKDFWVCWTLLQLFTMPQLQDRMIFKGGTSLSKCFDAIRRFSEDIDLIIDYQLLGYKTDQVVRGERSNSQWQAFLRKILEEGSVWVESVLRQLLEQRFRERLGPTGWSLSGNRESGSAVLLFAYPRSSRTTATPYVTPEIKLEPGPHAAHCPRGRHPIESFAATRFPKLFSIRKAHVDAIAIERTFWEKATILHAEFYRPAEKSTPARYARHYYDLAMLSKTHFRQSALSQIALLGDVVAHKKSFYPSSWARYDLAIAGSLRLVPQEGRKRDLKSDYLRMQPMLYDSPPTFEEICLRLEALEAEINAVSQDT